MPSIKFKTKFYHLLKINFHKFSYIFSSLTLPYRIKVTFCRKRNAFCRWAPLKRLSSKSYRYAWKFRWKLSKEIRWSWKFGRWALHRNKRIFSNRTPFTIVWEYCWNHWYLWHDRHPPTNCPDDRALIHIVFIIIFILVNRTLII